MKKIIETKNAPSPVGPYNQAIIANGILYCSGQIAIDPSSGVLITDDITKETTQVMKNIEAILKAAGSSFEQVIKCSIFIVKISEFHQFEAGSQGFPTAQKTFSCDKYISASERFVSGKNPIVTSNLHIRKVQPWYLLFDFVRNICLHL